MTPDHCAICRFRSKHRDRFKGVFHETVRLASEASALKIEHLFFDRTKMKASAALEANRSLERKRGIYAKRGQTVARSLLHVMRDLPNPVSLQKTVDSSLNTFYTEI
jgi:hypothetical protein